MSAETRLLAALDAFRDAFAQYLADRRTEPPPPAALLTITTAARALGVSRSTATRWIASGELPSRVLDGRRWIARADVDGLARRSKGAGPGGTGRPWRIAMPRRALTETNPTAPAVYAVPVYRGPDPEDNRAVLFDVHVGRRRYPYGGAVRFDAGWPQFWIPDPALLRGMDRDLDLTQAVGESVLAAL
jgi:excisionase family DNA binding protein